jgi:predicted amidohydrolase
MQITIAQIKPTLGDIEKNLKIHLEWIEKSAQADLIVFPELSLTGYFLKDQVPSVAMRLDAEPIKKILKATAQKDIIFGFVEKTSEDLYFIAQAYAHRGKIVHFHRKVYLPTYGIFDDSRFLAAGSELETFEIESLKAGMLICEDAWHYPMAYLLALKGAKVIFISSCSPLSGLANHSEEPQSIERWQKIAETYALLFGVYVVFANRVGVEDGITFSGASFVISPQGVILHQAKKIEEAALSFRLDLSAISRARTELPLLRDENLKWTLNQLKNI